MMKTLAIGAAHEGGFFGGIVRINDLPHGVIWAPKAEGQMRGAWLDSYTDVPSARSCFDSLANTLAMAEAGSPIAKWALGLNINGKTDWCVPARDVLELGYRLLKPANRDNYASFRDGDNASSVPVGYPYTEELPAQTEVAAFRSGGAEAFDETWYWSSTQYSADDAFIQVFSSGYQLSGDKKALGCVRAVRLIQLGT